MPLEPGTRLGPYELIGPLGAGGMGEVWRARDGRLGRDVAIKALPEAFAADPERLSRFEREAKILASLSHANIASIYGLEEADGRRYLVLECVEGPTLDERLAQGALPIGETLAVCRQIATALEAAHESGVVHRDLKPANVKLTPGGEVKVLDFGLAKGEPARTTESGADLSQSPTRTYALTSAGVILGTAAYMSPEQARGKGVDRRTDIWSFGCILYECLTGRQLFAGETISDMIAKILEREPDWGALPAQTPEKLRGLLRRCLEKDARRRLRDIGEARIELEDVETARASSMRAPVLSGSRRSPRWWAWGAVAVIALAGGVLAAARIWAPTPAQNPVRITISLPPGLNLPIGGASPAMAPDGRAVAFAAVDSAGATMLWVRRLDAYVARRLDGTEDASFPFWSPDARHVAFFAKGKLQRIAIAGGSPEVVCEANNGRGGSWSRSGMIVFAPAGEGPILIVPASGGDPSPATALDSTRGETGHRYPCFLPDGRRFLYTALPTRQGRYVTYVTGPGQKPRPVLEAASGAVYAAPGYLIFRRGAGLAAQRFDLRALRTRGEPLNLEETPGATTFSGSPQVSVSASGACAYTSGAVANTRLTWFDGSGRGASLPLPPGRYNPEQFSPDGTRLALTRTEPSGDRDIWIFDLARGTMSRFTFGPGTSETPVWSPDGRRIAFDADREGPRDLYVKAVAGGEETALFRSRATFKHPTSWTRDGRTLLFEVLVQGSGWDIWRVDLETAEAGPVLATRFNERFSTLSPDGRWMGYVSDESGVGEAYVVSFPNGEQRVQVSNRGAIGTVFTEDGTLTYFAQDGSMWTANVEPGPVLKIGAPRKRLMIPTSVVGGTLTPRGDRILLAFPDEEGIAPGLNVVLDWPALIRER